MPLHHFKKKIFILLWSNFGPYAPQTYVRQYPHSLKCVPCTMSGLGDMEEKKKRGPCSQRSYSLMKKVTVSECQKKLTEKMLPFFLNVRKGNIIFRRDCKGEVSGP